MPDDATGLVFSDFSITDFNAAWIERLLLDGIIVGCSAMAYCPTQVVTKAELAILLLKTKQGSAYILPTATGNVFDDVALDDFAADWIEDLFNQGITTGCDAIKYCPNELVTQDGLQTLLSNSNF